MNKTFSIIVAIDQNSGIGKNNSMPWHLPGDMRHFKEVTSAAPAGRFNYIIMGRKTWESIPEQFRPFSGRINAVLTRDPAMRLPRDVFKFSDFDDALKGAQNHPTTADIFVIGGAEIFKLAVAHPLCSRIFVTHIQAVFPCDRFFPPIPPAFKETERSDVFQDAAVGYFMSIYSRNSS